MHVAIPYLNFKINKLVLFVQIKLQKMIWKSYNHLNAVLYDVAYYILSHSFLYFAHRPRNNKPESKIVVLNGDKLSILYKIIVEVKLFQKHLDFLAPRLGLYIIIGILRIGWALVGRQRAREGGRRTRFAKKIAGDGKRGMGSDWIGGSDLSRRVIWHLFTYGGYGGSRRGVRRTKIKDEH